jgi:hypothetical protein
MAKRSATYLRNELLWEPGNRGRRSPWFAVLVGGEAVVAYLKEQQHILII